MSIIKKFKYTRVALFLQGLSEIKTTVVFSNKIFMNLAILIIILIWIKLYDFQKIELDTLQNETCIIANINY